MRPGDRVHRIEERQLPLDQEPQEEGIDSAGAGQGRRDAGPDPVDARLAAHYDHVAETYEADRYRSGPGALLHALERRVVLAWAAGGKGSRALDVPCGTGRLTGALAERGSLVVGCDLSASMLHRARDRAPGGAATGSVVFTRASVGRLPFPDRAFDTVVCVNFLQLVPRARWPGLLTELRRVLRPGGTLLVEFKTFKKLAPVWWLRRRPSRPGDAPVRPARLRPGDARALVRGFRKRRVIGLLFPVPPRLAGALGRGPALAAQLLAGRVPILRWLAASLVFDLRREP